MNVSIKSIRSGFTAVLAGGLFASSSLAAVTVSTTPDAQTFDPTLGTPAVNTAGTLSGSIQSSFTVSQTLNAGTGVLSQTFVPGTSFTLDKIAIYVAGGAASNVGLHLYANPAGGTETDGFANVSGLTDLFGGGAGLTFNYDGTASQNFIVLDLSGLDEVALASGTKYALELSGGSSSLFLRRTGSSSPYAGGNIYQGTTDNTVSRTDVSGSGKRDSAVALYAVPEPTSLALLGLGGMAVLRRRRA